jgi:beta-lactamase class A
MKSKALRRVLGGLGVFFVLSALVITLVEYNRFTGQTIVFPAGSRVADVPVGGLDAAAAEARLAEFYALPLVLVIEGERVHVDPSALGFTMDPAELVAYGMAQVELATFWDFLRGHANPSAIVEVPLAATVDEVQVRAFLEEQIVPRYTQLGVAIAPLPGTTNFTIGKPSQHLVVDQAVADIRSALLSPITHQVTVQIEEGELSAVTDETLKAFLRHNIEWIGFDGLVEIYLESMETGRNLQFAIRAGEDVQPGIAFPAASTNKIPIMVSVLRRTPEPTPDAVVTLLNQMIGRSENPPADTLMSVYLDEVRGPLVVSQDMAALGLENTFLAGYFYLGAPLLQLFDTPANTRQDVFLAPDRYNQTAPADIGRLLAAIYDCAENGSGLLIETFPGEITQNKCRLMIDVLAANQIGLLIEAGLPYGASAAHKHGWAPDLDGQLRFMSDVAIVLTEGGDYVLNIFLHDPDRLDFDQGNRLVARLSQTVYNVFNLNNQAYWWFD